MKENIIKKKSYDFAIRVIKLYKYLIEQQQEWVLSKQILRSGTSVGANIEEACSGQSKKDFIAKHQIALKEAKETHYWLRLLRDSNYIEEVLANSLIHDIEEIIIVLVSILKTAKQNI